MPKKREKTIGWYLHKEHGFMYRGSVDEYGYQPVVTALCLNTSEIEKDKDLWESHKNRLHVNGGCGAVCVSEAKEGDHNPAFEKISYPPPRHIFLDFMRALNGV